ncbi:aspartyl-phosphate phosphatase Spo0E family protein [Wukongibacter sp. M2B1]|uniref:aspartyl-phosphate phosphatase Spo0E family protein n=1 Tax=Wukongibacter sp. M2B1 TaxID=3088895 RepID=UPI003D7916A5
MTQVKDMVVLLEELRYELNTLIIEGKELTDSEVIEVSQKLDRMLNRYNKLTACASSCSGE